MNNIIIMICIILLITMETIRTIRASGPGSISGYLKHTYAIVSRVNYRVTCQLSCHVSTIVSRVNYRVTCHSQY